MTEYHNQNKNEGHASIFFIQNVTLNLNQKSDFRKSSKKKSQKSKKNDNQLFFRLKFEGTK
jgi:hypothetical protein